MNPNYPKLDFNPFVTPSRGFFSGAERQRCLEHLCNVGRWSDPVVVVTGEQGVGKTSVFRAVAEAALVGVKVARVSGTLVATAQDVLHEMCEAFGISVPENADTQRMHDEIVAYMKSAGATGQEPASERYLVLIDDAHLIEPRGVDALMTLVDEDAPLYMALFADEIILTVLENAAAREGSVLTWQHLPLIPLSNPMIREYLTFRFAQAGHRARLPFSERQIQNICTRSRGNLGRLNDLANRELIQLERGAEGFPPRHRALAIAMTVVLVATYFIWDTFDGDPVGSVEIGAVPSASSNDSIPVGVDAPDVFRDEPANAGEDLEPIELTVGDTLVALEPEDPVEPGRGTSEAGVAEAEPAIVVDPDPVPETVTTPVVEIAEAKPRRLGPHGANDAGWLLAQSASDYTLQLLSASSMANLTDYIGKQADPERFAIFESTSKGKPIYVVVYGTYNTRDEAVAASRRLPSAVGSVDPWIRQFGGIQRTIR